MANKLFCTFAKSKNLDSTIDYIIDSYDIIYNKIFVFYALKTNEFVCTYNVDLSQSRPELIRHTILVHRKKETNSLYTINALNALVRSLNEGIEDPRFVVPWENYRNCLLLTQNGNELKKLYLKMKEIVELE